MDAPHQIGEQAVEGESTVVDHQHARRQRRHVDHVVAGEQDGGAVLLVVATDERAQRGLHGDVEADGRLVQEQDGGPMDERGRQLALHALAERELTRRLLEQRLELEHGDQLVEHLAIALARHAVDRAVELEGLGRRQVPQQLLLLAGDEHDPAQEVGMALGGVPPGHADLAGGGVQEARHHLERGGLAGAVGSEEPHPLAGADLKLDVVDGAHGLVVAAKQRLHRGAEAGRTDRHAVVLDQTADGDQRESSRQPTCCE